MPETTGPLPQGTLDLLILKTLAGGPRHGYAVARWIEEVTGDALSVEEGSLYPALHRMEKAKLIKGEWRVTENGRKARVYTLTSAGRRRLEEAEFNWTSAAKGIQKLLRFA
jgi:transcriptional regulator